DLPYNFYIKKKQIIITLVRLVQICLNENTEFHIGSDGEQYVVIWLETSPKDEDGVLVYARRFDLYLLSFGMKNHSIFQFKIKLVANGSGFGFANDYRSLGGLTNVQVGVNAFNCAIQRLLKYFRSDDDNLLMWKKEITKICVFVFEAARNKYILYDRYKRIEGSVSLWSPLLIRSWKNCSKKDMSVIMILWLKSLMPNGS
nr:hypothetical protein [Tanacetum cinerariifolium]